MIFIRQSQQRRISLACVRSSDAGNASSKEKSMRESNNKQRKKWGKVRSFGLRMRLQTGTKSMYILRGKLFNMRWRNGLRLAKMANERDFTKAFSLNAFAKCVQDVSKNQLQYHDVLWRLIAIFSRLVCPPRRSPKRVRVQFGTRGHIASQHAHAL